MGVEELRVAGALAESFENRVKPRETGSIGLQQMTGTIVEGLIGRMGEIVDPEKLRSVFFTHYPKDKEGSQQNFLSAAGVTAVCLLGDLMMREAAGEVGVDGIRQEYKEAFEAIFLKDHNEDWQVATATGVVLDLGIALIFEPEPEIKKERLDQYTKWLRELFDGYKEVENQASLNIIADFKPEEYSIDGKPLDAVDMFYLHSLISG